MKYYALSISNEFIDIAQKESVPITLLRLMKLTYIAHGFMLAILNQDVDGAKNDKVEAWKFGPVFPSVYYQFNKYGNNNITEKTTLPIFTTKEDGEYDIEMFEPTLECERKKKICYFVWKRYFNTTTSDLVNILHANGTPWWRVYQEGRNVVIPDSYTKEYYLSVVQEIVNNHG